MTGRGPLAGRATVVSLGALELVRGRGSFVADAPPPRAEALADPSALIAQADNLARQAFALAQSQGVDPHDLARRIAALASPPLALSKDPNP